MKKQEKRSDLVRALIVAHSSDGNTMFLLASAFMLLAVLAGAIIEAFALVVQ